jgi:chromosome segregation ATPase
VARSTIDKKLAATQAERQQLQQLLASCRAASSETSARSERLNQELQERATQISQLQADLTELQAQLSERTNEREQLRRQIDSIHGSICWRLTSPIRWLHKQVNRARSALSKVRLS